MAETAGLVLAGGGSRRMGRDKAALMLGGHTLAGRMADKLRAAGCAPVLLSGQGGLADQYPGKGPLAGIQAAFAHAGGIPALLIVPVDMPGLREKSLHRLARTPGKAVFYEGHSLPLKLAISAPVRARLEVTLSTPGADLSIRAFVASLDYCVLPGGAADDPQWTNLNTPADFALWCERMEKSHETQA